MILHEYTIKVPTRGTPVKIWFIGDTHVGAAGCSIDELQETVAEVAADKHSYWLGMGDYCDYISFRDKRFDPSQIDPDYRIQDLKNLAERQSHHFCKIMQPIRNKCIGLLEGNHEEAWYKYYHWSAVHDLAAWAGDGCKALSYDALIRIRIKDDTKKTARYSFDIYAHHGYGGARTEGADLNKVHNLSFSIDADVYAMGHGHKLLPNAFSRVGMMDGAGGAVKLRTCERPLIFFLTGSYLKTYSEGESNYAARKAYRATKLGSPYLRVSMINRTHSGKEEVVMKGST